MLSFWHQDLDGKFAIGLDVVAPSRNDAADCQNLRSRFEDHRRKMKPSWLKVSVSIAISERTSIKRKFPQRNIFEFPMNKERERESVIESVSVIFDTYFWIVLCEIARLCKGCRYIYLGTG